MLGSHRRAGDALVTHVPVHGEVLQGASLGLWNEEGGENTCEHEGGENLHDVVKPRAGIGGSGVTANAQRRDSTLSDDGADLSHSRGDPVRGRPVAGGEALARNDEGGCVWSPCWHGLAQFG